MNVEMVVLRLLHIVLGVFWAGAAFFVSSYLAPSIRTTWPAGGQVLHRLIERRFLQTLPVIAGLTILTGLRMYWIVSGGLDPSWIHSGPGLCYSLGGLAALAAFVVGLIRIRPAAVRFDTAMRAAAVATEGSARETHFAEAQVTFASITSAIRWAGALLGVAVVMMAVARYV